MIRPPLPILALPPSAHGNPEGMNAKVADTPNGNVLFKKFRGAIFPINRPSKFVRL
jgi:hypothetical protein